MICNSRFVLFVPITLLVCFYLGLADDLKLFIASWHIIFKCPTGEFLFIVYWNKFQSSNLTCPNQVHLLEQSLDIFGYNSTYSDCDEKNRLFSFSLELILASSADHNNSDITDEQLNLLSSKVTIENETLQFTPKRIKHSRLVLNEVVLKWNDNRFYKWRIVLDKQPIACLIHVDFNPLILNETCANKSISHRFVCYHDPLSISPLENVDWDLLDDFIVTHKYSLHGLKEKGAILYDPKSQTSTTTTTTSVSRRR